MQPILNAQHRRSLKNFADAGFIKIAHKPNRPQAHTKKAHSMTNTNQSTTQPTEQEKELQAISNAEYDKAIDNGCSEEEAEAISNKAYDNAEEIIKQENEREEK